MIFAELLTLAKLVTNFDDAVPLVNNTIKELELTVPAGKRWFLMGGYFTNGDDVARNSSVSITDGTDTILWLRASSAMADGATYLYPTTVASNSNIMPTGMFVLDAGWTIKFYWAAGGASTGGNSTITAMVLEVDV